MPTFKDNPDAIGHTPLVKINRIAKGLKATILAKIEGRNPAYSVKDRIGAAMIWDAEKTGKLKPGMQVVEPTSETWHGRPTSVAWAGGLPVDPDHARHDVDGTADDAQGLRCNPRAHPGG